MQWDTQPGSTPDLMCARWLHSTGLVRSSCRTESPPGATLAVMLYLLGKVPQQLNMLSLQPI